MTITDNLVPILDYEQFSSFMKSCILSAHESETYPVYPPDLLDLYALYSRVRKEKAIAILEFGSGWSTLALTKALEENRISYGQWVAKNIRHPNPYSIMTIDCSEFFQNIACARIVPHKGSTEVLPIISKSTMALVLGQACHLYQEIPPFTADFIYLDGPDCDQVEGAINGMTVNFGSPEHAYGLPMSADLYLLEHFFWPGTTIVTDGRGANARFLKTIFRRNWKYEYDDSCDQHVFQLNEQPWGVYSSRLIELKK